jgi:hypothetical protein
MAAQMAVGWAALMVAKSAVRWADCWDARTAERWAACSVHYWVVPSVAHLAAMMAAKTDAKLVVDWAEQMAGVKAAQKAAG